ncbi:hypothetical protein [Grimontia indica]
MPKRHQRILASFSGYAE